MQHSAIESLSVNGRDFNPAFVFLLGLLIKLFGISPIVLRAVSLVIFSSGIWMFSHILSRYFGVHAFISLSIGLLAGFNVFISEAVLNLSALVYPLSFVFFAVALKFYLDQKRLLFLLFLIGAFMTKETVILALIPLFLYEQSGKKRLFIGGAATGLVLVRWMLQWGASANYVDFAAPANFVYKLYFILLRSGNLSPFFIPLVMGITLIVLVIGFGLYLIGKRERASLFFLSFLIVFALFLSFLPKLSSRYVFYPSLGWWGLLALMFNYLFNYVMTRKKNRRITKSTISTISIMSIIPALLILFLSGSIGTNYASIRREIEDYKILGDFSKRFVAIQSAVIKRASADGKTEVMLNKGDVQDLTSVYRQIMERANLPKLLPFRSHGIEGVIEPQHLIPLIFYPQKVCWRKIQETNEGFIGEIRRVGVP
ncbi:MAG: hypothetical protein ACM3SY_06900 [Candidatus Omnitrophota bacterium]